MSSSFHPQIHMNSARNMTSASTYEQLPLPWLKCIYVGTIDTGQHVNSVDV